MILFPQWLRGSILLFLLVSKTASALQFHFPPEISDELLSESVPMAFEVAPFRVEDFQVEWEGAVPEGATATFIHGSLDWVRISTILVLPRARIRVYLPNVESAEVRVGGGVHPFHLSNGTAELEFPVALLSQDRRAPEIQFKKGSKTETFRMRTRFRPAPGSAAAQLKDRAFIDPSCYAHRLEVAGIEKLPAHQWLYFGCRQVRSLGKDARVPQLEIVVYWDGAREPLMIQGLPEPEVSSSTWRIRTGPRSTPIRISSGEGTELEISVKLPQRLSTAFLGAGVGPYSYIFDDGAGTADSTVRQTAPIVTLYGSYFLSETSRVIFFDAFSVHRRAYNDFGLYFSSESSRALDEKFSVNILLGFHIVSFSSNGVLQNNMGAPQGFEMILRDVFGKTRNLSVGGFFYPPIDGKAYYNAWLRVGTPRLFGEINYLSWREKTDANAHALSRSMGICIGAPLLFY